ncbi:hypothetical protein ABZV77_11520 [Streptomyces sp. NPDC004732]|uniref:hypothetical protein n=1 Tax=Streptomyces sp. NPDC004732 TaxID=3154290 RepID=UPI0033BD639C
MPRKAWNKRPSSFEERAGRRQRADLQKTREFDELLADWEDVLDDEEALDGSSYWKVA